MTRRTRMLVLGMASAVALTVLVPTPSARAAAPGDLDLSFAGDGISVPGFGRSAEDVVIQPDGKIVMVGSTGAQGQSDFGIARLDPDGTLDTSFSGDGKVTTSFGTSTSSLATDVALQSDGDIVVSGVAYGGSDTSWDFAVAVYNPDGSLDTGFSTNGLRILDLDDEYDWAYAVAVQSDNKILVGGRAGIGGDGDFGIARFTTAGSLDPTFGGDGIVTTGFGESETLSDLALQPDGKIVAVGDGEQGGDFDFLAARYTTSGSPDNGFNIDGKVAVALGGNDIAHAVAIQADGKIVVVGSRTTFPDGGTNVDFALARLTATGFLDVSFHGDGKRTEPLASAQAFDVAVQANGLIVIAGQVNTIDPDAVLARYTSAGDLDTTFSNNGVRTLDLNSSGDDYATSLAIDEDGKIVVAGYRPGFVAARLHASTDNPPSTTITSGPSGTTSDSTPTFHFTSSEAGSTFECRVDAGSYAACTSPRTLSSLSEGEHTFRVRAIDDSAQPDATPATRTFTVDTTPNTTITSGPSGPTSDSTPTYFFSSSESGSTFTCAVDDAPYAACTSPHTTAVLPDGEHTFRVRATDSDGTPHTDATPAERTVTVDTMPPDTVIDTAPSGAIDDATPTITFHGVEATTFRCAVDAATPAPCTSPWTTPALPDGPHTAKVWGVDAVGNVDPSPATATFTVDTAPPDTMVDAGPTDWSRDATPTFEFSATEAATFECAFDGAEFATCTSPYTPTETLSEGPHTFFVRATDVFDHVDATPAQRTFTVDTVPPNTAITAGPSGTIGRRTVRFSFDALGEAADRFACRLDGRDWKPCTSPKTYDDLGRGDHVFRVRAYDAAGNPDPTPARREFRIELD